MVSSKEGSIAEVEYHGLRAESMPKHVALFIDDDRVASRRVLHDIARICCDLGIKVLSIYTHSCRNFLEPKEVGFVRNITKSELEDLARNDIRVSVIGKRSAILDSQLKIIKEAEESTKNNRSLHIIEAIDYTGCNDIIQACIAFAEMVINGLIQPEDIEEDVFEQELETKCSEFPNPDLMIRTGGKYSIDNYMLWQMAYSELYFVEKDDTEFNNTSFIKALHEYLKRSRRFGGK
ncbi:hypothetical protein SSX86_015333 [Deinandra increscens subsp. villosa]|uniref:Alkyl transferase n=1 Tax=Deinandra increscens subsp. villosa TaxID=3103831 RepID=A0AAP0D192_9ASTR